MIIRDLPCPIGKCLESAPPIPDEDQEADDGDAGYGGVRRGRVVGSFGQQLILSLMLLLISMITITILSQMIMIMIMIMSMISIIILSKIMRMIWV